MSAAYIAHADRDNDHLMQVHEALRQAGVPSTFAATDDQFTAKSQNQLDVARVLIVLVSANALRSKRVQEAVKYAKARQLPIISYQVDKTKLSITWQAKLGGTISLNRSDPNDLATLTNQAKKIYNATCPVVAVMNMKGGVGKTTVSAQVFGTYQAEIAGRVLIIDLDPQYNLTQVFFDMDTADANAFHDASAISLFEKSRLHGVNTSPADDWSKLSTLPFAPANPEELMQEINLGGPPGRLDLICGQFEICKYAFSTDRTGLDAVAKNFQSMIDHYRSFYDLIVIDTNPNATFLTEVCVKAADHVLVPMQADMYSLRGVKLVQMLINRSQGAATTQPHILFNRVHTTERSEFEAEARLGKFDDTVDFALSKAILEPVLPYSRHYITPSPREDTPPWRQLLCHHGRGGGLKTARAHLSIIASVMHNRLFIS